MKQLFAFMFSNIVIMAGEMIDTSFMSNAGIDALCATAAYNSISNLCYKIYNIGAYAYRVMMSRIKACIAVQITLSSIIGVLCLVFCNQITMIFDLSRHQRFLLKWMIIIYAVQLPLRGFSMVVTDWLTFNCLNKHLIRANVIFYVTLIIGDAIVFILKQPVYWMIFATMISYIINDAYMLAFTGILKTDDKVDKESIKDVINFGLNVSIGRSFGGVCKTFVTSLASCLGTYEFALYGVASNVMSCVEYVTNSSYYYGSVKVKNANNKMKTGMNELRKICVPEILVSTVAMMICVISMHGETNLSDALKCSLLACTNIIVHIIWGMVYSITQTSYMVKLGRNGEIVDSITMVTIALLAVHFKLGLTIFLLLSTAGTTAYITVLTVGYLYNTRKERKVYGKEHESDSGL